MFNPAAQLPSSYFIGSNIADSIEAAGKKHENRSRVCSEDLPYINSLDDLLEADNPREEQVDKLVEATLYLNRIGEKSPNLRQKLERAMKIMPPETLSAFLQKMALEGVKQKKPELHSLTLSLISYDRMQEVMASMESKYSDGYQDISQIAEDVAKYYLAPPESKVKESFFLELRRSLSFVINFIPNLINTFLIAFSLYDIGKDPQSAWEASAMLDVYYKFFMIPATLVVALKVLFPAIGLSVYGMAAVIITLAIVALVIYIKWFQPCPNTLPHCHNLTQDIELGYQSPVIGREKEIDRLVKMFSSLDKSVANHALLVGPSGVGKTEIVKGLAQRIVEGHKDIPKSLRNKKIFLINTASLVQGGMFGYADQMKFLLNRIKGREEEAIFFFDEVHVASREKKLSDYLEQELNRDRLHCVAATTTEEYMKTILPDKALDRRFEKIFVSEMDNVNTKEVLQSIIRESAKCVIVDDAVLDHLIQKTNELMEKERAAEGGSGKGRKESMNNHHQPWFSVQVLTGAMNKVASSVEDQYIPPALMKKKNLLKSLRLSLNANSGFRLTAEAGRKKLLKIRTLENEIKNEEKQLKIKRQQIKTFKILQKRFQEYNDHLKKQAASALCADEKNKLKELKKFYWEYEYLIPQLSKHLNHLKRKVNDKDFKIVVDKPLVERVLEELLQSENKKTLSDK